jgi:tetratricopeptide (TPR) repeat protein
VRRAQIDFHVGRHLRISEPFFKFGQDGKPFVRIDQPSDDLAFIPDPRPADGAAWHALGNQFYGCKHSSVAAARECWNRALVLLGGTAATLLSNRSAANLGMRSCAPAALDAGAALLLDPTNQKAAFRLAAALSQMPNQEANSRALARLCVGRFPAAKGSFEPLLQSTPGVYSDDEDVPWCASGAWWENGAAMSFLAAEASRPPTASTMASLAADADGDSVALRPSSWEERKRDGNERFRQAQFPEAAAAYSQALTALPETDKLVKLLCNLAVMADSDFLDRLGEATCALVLRPSHVKAWAGRVSALQALGGRDDAILASCKAGRAAAEAVLGSDSTPAPDRAATDAAMGAFLKAEGKVHAKSEAGGAGESSASGLSTDEQRARRNALDPSEKSESDAAYIAQISMFRDILQLMPASEQEAMFGRKVEMLPNLEMELLKHGGGWPVGVDREWATNRLRRAYEEGSMSFLLDYNLKRASFTPPTKEVHRQLGGLHPAKVQWWLGGGPPDVCDESELGINRAYNPYVRHSFSNEMYPNIVLTRGTTHVAIGLVALGILLASELRGAQAGASDSAPSSPSSSSSPLPDDTRLRFIGVETSAYSVAKTLVIWEMLRHSPPLSHPEHDACLRAVLQAWLSTTWTAGTHPVVAKALASLRSSAKVKQQPDSVQRMLHHWAGSDGVSLRRARAEHAKSIGLSVHLAKHLLRRVDCIAMSKYELTGDFGVGAHPSCGNVLRFDCPDGTPAPDNNESVLGTLDLTVVVDAVQRAGGGISIFQAAEQLLLRSLSKVAGWATRGDVTGHLRCFPGSRRSPTTSRRRRPTQ